MIRGNCEVVAMFHCPEMESAVMSIAEVEGIASIIFKASL